MKPYFIFIFILILNTGFSQTFTARILDADTGEPIPFATVVTGPDRGTISNEEGYFSLDLSSLATSGIQFSCMGYKSMKYTKANLQGLRDILLKPAAIELNEVRVGNRIPGAEEIILEVRNNLSLNYQVNTANYQVFFRESEYMNFEELDLELEKASDLGKKQMQRARKELEGLGKAIEESRAVKFLDLSGQIQREKDSSLFRVDRATELVDTKKNYSMDEIQERAKKIILSHLDTTQSYKVKTGMFTIEDSLSMQDEWNSEPSDSVETSYLKRKVNSLLNVADLEEDGRVFGFLDPEAYRYELLKATYFDGHYVYALAFKPLKRKSKYAGTLYVDAATFAILKADFRYAEGRRGEKVNLRLLLGVKYVENLDRGTVIYRQAENKKYSPYYIQKEYGNYVYLHRSLKFIENSSSRKKVRFDFLLEGGVRQKESMLLGSTDSEAYADQIGRVPEKVLLRKLQSYEPTIWQDSEIIAPLEEMKNFKVSN